MYRSKREITDPVLLLKALNANYEQEYRFHPKRRWRFDFALVEDKIAIEIEGGTWINGRHSRALGYTKDCEKYNTAALMGWRILRFTSDMIRDGKFYQFIKEVLNDKT